ncbi:MAG: hypothetical protein R3C11_27900 [Planctomycetaceae bacterium]
MSSLFSDETSSADASENEDNSTPTNLKTNQESEKSVLEEVQFEEQSEPEVVYRPVDRRQVPEPELLEKLGINVVESTHAKIYSDLPVEKIEEFPALIDGLIKSLEDYFGPLPPDRDGKPFQLSGYVMQDVPLYTKSGLLPPKFALLQHGRHQGAEFWMVVPTAEYYLRHLLLHEATHCFMMYMPRTQAPVWYLEGMAELFATHRLRENGEVDYHVFPEATEKYEGFGRIELIKQDVSDSGYQTIEQVTNLESGGYQSNISYAWAWALCSFFENNPKYQDQFRQLSRRYLQEEPFAENFREAFADQAIQLNQEWISMIAELEYGMEFERLNIEFTAGTQLTGPTEVPVAAARGWQNSRIKLEEGKMYQLEAAGEFVLAETTKPWTSTARGISFDYYRGIPMGCLLGVIVPEEEGEVGAETCFAEFARFGERIKFQSPYTGTLFLRLNDRPDRLFDNVGQVMVELEELASE